MDEEKYNFRVVQKAEVRSGKKYLLIKRSPNSPMFPNCWDFAGGKLEHGETPSQGILREVKEETGLSVELLHPKFVSTNGLKNHFGVIIVWGCKSSSKKIKLSFEHTEYKWVTKEKALSLELEPYLKEYFEQL